MNKEPNPNSSGSQGPETGHDPLGSSDAAGKSFGSERDGTLKVPLDAQKPSSETLWMREQHNANHALWYFEMIVDSILQGRFEQNNRQKTERILAHLSCLREVAREDRRDVKMVTDEVFNTLLTEYPDEETRWEHFIYIHWNLLRNFANQFGHGRTCFTDGDYQKIADLMHHRQILKAWWWHSRIEQFLRRRSLKMKFKNSSPAKDRV